MLFNLNEFLLSVSFALDFVEMDILGVKSNHGKRVAYISLRIAQELKMTPEQLYDIATLSILHDNGVSEKWIHDKLSSQTSLDIKALDTVKEHCIIGEENSSSYPFLTDVSNVIKYHHEKYDGTGYFKVKGSEIPLMSQIISLADTIEIKFNLQNNDSSEKESVISYVTQQSNIAFSPEIADAFCNVANDNNFWSELKDKYIDSVINKMIPKFSLELSFEEIHNITRVLSKIIDSKSRYTYRHSAELSNKVAFMADFYGIKGDEKMKLVIAADLHDIGKLAVPNQILDSPRALTNQEFEIIKKHTYYTRMALQEIKGFEDITEWASNHHEKLNGMGYPYGFRARELDFNSRLMGCLDIYEALTEDRPYRLRLSHNEAIEILTTMSKGGFVDSEITEYIDIAFKNYIRPDEINKLLMQL